MSRLANPAGAAKAQAAAYTASILAALNGRDPFEVMRETPDTLAAATVGIPEDLIGVPEGPWKWSVRHVLAHLADSELVASTRFRMVLAQDRPPIVAFDQDLWAERLGYEDSDAMESLNRFTTLRRANLRLLERTSEEERARVGLHSERGEESIALMLQLYAGHDIVHIRQIERIKGAIAT